jgi:DNA-binding beta-propeller fold protein YncE
MHMRPVRPTPFLPALALMALTAGASAQVVLDNHVVAPVDDAELTPDGRLAVLREHTGWQSRARVLDARTGALVFEYTASSTNINGAAQDAVAATNERAVVIGSSAMVLDLSASPALLAEHPIGQFPRDLAITPDGSKVVIRGGSDLQGGLYVLDLASGAQLAFAPGLPAPVPASSFDVDSVVATDRHGVLLSWVPPPADRARVTVFDLQPSGGGAPVVVFETGPGGPALDQLGAPHDLTLVGGGDYAAVRSELSVGLYRLDGTSTRQVWHKRLWGAPGPFGGSALDSIEASADRIATISRRSNGGAGAQLDVLDLAGTQWHAPMQGDPHDLEITPDGTRVLVRTSAGVYLFDLTSLPATPLLTPLDFVAVSSTNTSFGAGLDSVAVTDTRAVTLHRQGISTAVRLWDLSGNALADAGQLTLPNKPCDVDISPNGRWAAVTGTDHVQVIDLIAGRLALDHEPASALVGQYPWCDGVVLDDERVVAFGYTYINPFPGEGWISVVDLDLGSYEYCPGRPSSIGVAGRLEPTGSTSVTLNSAGLLATRLPASTVSALWFGKQSTWQTFGDGLLCITGERYTPGLLPVDPTGAAFQPLDFLGSPQQGGVIDAGSTWYFQVWYRDPASVGAGYNTTNGVKLTFQP